MSRKPSEQAFFVAIGFGLFAVFLLLCLALWALIVDFGIEGVLILGFLGAGVLAVVALVVALILYFGTEQQETSLRIIRTMILYARKLYEYLDQLFDYIQRKIDSPMTSTLHQTAQMQS